MEKYSTNIYPLDCHNNSLPLNNLLPLHDIIEVRCNHYRDFVWLHESKSQDHFLSHIGWIVSYANEIMAFAENNWMKTTDVKGTKMVKEGCKR